MTTPPEPPAWAAPDAPAPGAGRGGPAGPHVAAPEVPGAQPQPGYQAQPGQQPHPGHQAQPGWQPQPGWQGQQGWGAAPPGWGGPAPRGWGAPPPPEVKPGVVPLRPVGLGELLDGAVNVVRRYPRPTLGLSAAIAIVTTLVNLPFLLSLRGAALLDPARANAGDVGPELDALGGALAGVGLGALLSLLANVVLAGVITAVVGRAVLGQPMSLGQAWRQVRPLVLRLVGLALVVLLVVAGAALLGGVVAALAVAVAGLVGLVVGVPVAIAGIVAAVHLYVRFALAPSAMVLERAGVRQSLRRSAVLVRGDWWRVLGILLLAGLITGFVGQVLQAPFAARSFLSALSAGAQPLSTVDLVLSSVGSALALTVVAPFGAAVRALLYVDRRIRAEALDLALAAAAAPPRP